MAVPTVATLDPVQGHTGGRTMIDLAGTNFRLPTIPPSGETDGVLLETVEVLFGTELSPLVQVLSDDRLLVTAPINDAGSVAITVRNVDDLGVPIPGESVVLASGYEFLTPKLFTDPKNSSELTRLVMTLIQEMRRQIVGEVSLATHTDYDAATNAELHVVELSTLPGLILIGPDLEENRFYSLNEQPEFEVTPGDPDTEFVETEVPYTVDVTFDIVGFSNNPMEMINLQHAATIFFKKNKVLRMDMDADDLSKGRVEYEIDLTPDGDLKRTGQPNNSNIMSFSGKMVVRGFDIDQTAGIDSGADIAGVPKNEIINRGFTSDETDGVELDPVEQIGISSPLVVRSIKSTGGC